MRTIILTSEYLPEVQKEILRLLPAPPNLMRVAFVLTARKWFTDHVTVEKHIDRNLMINAGFIVEDYDFDGKSQKEVVEDLSQFDVVYVAGGSTFYLLESMHRVDFAQIVRELLDKGIIYIGESAGSIVAGPDIKPAEWINDKNQKNMRDLTGLFLVPFGVVPHIETKLLKSAAQEVIKAPYDVKYLRDDQLMYVNGNEVLTITAK